MAIAFGFPSFDANKPMLCKRPNRLTDRFGLHPEPGGQCAHARPGPASVAGVTAQGGVNCESMGTENLSPIVDGCIFHAEITEPPMFAHAAHALSPSPDTIALAVSPMAFPSVSWATRLIPG